MKRTKSGFVHKLNQILKAQSVIEQRLIEWQDTQEMFLRERLMFVLADARQKMLDVFDEKFEQNYIVKSDHFNQLRLLLTKEVFDPRYDYRRIGVFRFKSYTIPYSIKQYMIKQVGNVPSQTINVVAQINPDPFAETLQEASVSSYNTGGQSVFAVFSINLDFHVIDDGVLNWLSNYQIQLSRAISNSISTRVRFEILESIKNAEGIPEIRRRIAKVWDDPIDVVVPAKIDGRGNVIRAGYTYQMSNEEWLDVVARTEVSRAFSEGRIEAYNQMGVVNKVQFSVSPDRRLCPNCAALEGTEFSLQSATGVIPLHARCRCTWIPIIDGSFSEVKAVARGNVLQKYGISDSEATIL